MNRFWDIIDLFVKWITRSKKLYRITGMASVAYLFFELDTSDIPTEAAPNYNKIGEKYGEFVKSGYGWLVDKFGGGVNWIGVAIAFILLLFCILIEFNILKPQKIINAKNVFSGWFQINTQTNYYDKE